jgi:outer membrane protein assembly factor BamA
MHDVQTIGSRGVVAALLVLLANQYDFHRIDVNLQQYVPLTDRYRILALRADAVLTDGHHGHAVPFYFQPTLGGAKELRGYRDSGSAIRTTSIGPARSW